MRTKAIKLFWSQARGGRNFGDVLTKYLLERELGLKVEYAIPAHSEIVGAGSILQRLPLTGYRGVVFGTGKMYAEKKTPNLSRAIVLGIRGRLTAGKMDVPLFDPGILAFLYKPARARKRFKTGIIPHYTLYREALERAQPGERVINLLAGIPEIVKEASECERIVSSSLHGVILADSLRIPREVVLRDEVWGNGYKFRDWESAIEERGIDRIAEDAYSALKKIPNIFS